jgi:hypothetical protein
MGTGAKHMAVPFPELRGSVGTLKGSPDPPKASSAVLVVPPMSKQVLVLLM